MSCKIASLSSGCVREKLFDCLEDAKVEEEVGDGAEWNLGCWCCTCVSCEKGDEEEGRRDASWSGVAGTELVSE